jgi:glycogen operon protein
MSWIDWTCLERHKEIQCFVRGMIAFRRAHPVLSREQFYTDADIQWLGPSGGLPNWFDHKEKAFACVIQETGHDALLMIFNAGADSIAFHLPSLPEAVSWRLAVDTSGVAPFAEGEEPMMDSFRPYSIEARSSAILLARKQVK